MYYFRKNNNSFEKYSVTFNKELLEQQAEQMKYEYSKKTHIEEEKETQPIPGDDYLVINLQMTKCGENEYYEETVPVYHLSYDLVKIPYLVKYITRLVKGDLTVLNNIFEYNPRIDYVPNDNGVSADIYYEEVLKLIDVRLVDVLSISEVKKVSDFFDVNVEEKIDSIHNELPSIEKMKTKSKSVIGH